MTPLGVQQRVNVLSDTELYVRAVQLAQAHSKVKDAQLNGLLQYAQNWPDLESFIARQEKRDWAGEDSYAQFYTDLRKELQQIERTAGQLVPDGGERRDQPPRGGVWLGLLGRDFVQHLVAEIQFARTRKQSNHGSQTAGRLPSGRPAGGRRHSGPAQGRRPQRREE